MERSYPLPRFAGRFTEATFDRARGASRPLPQRRRAIRVWILLTAIVLLSAADLYMTLTHLRSVGMGEANPLARLVMSYQSPLILSLWKAACVGLAVLILVLARFRPSGEVACWVCCVTLTALTLQWIHYSSEASKFTDQINAAITQDPTTDWVSMQDR